MAIDGLVIHALIHELQNCVGGRINKIYQPNEHDIRLHIRAQGKNQKLILSANPTYPRAHLTEGSSRNPMEAPMFCMLLRKHCENGIIESIHQIELERIFHIKVRQRDELGDFNRKVIVVEIMGRHSNIILLDLEKNIIFDSIHHINALINRHRVVLPGAEYITPPDQGKINPLNCSEDQMNELFRNTEFGEEEKSWQFILNNFSGISPITAKEIVSRCEISLNCLVNELLKNEQQKQKLIKTFIRLMQQLKNNQYQPTILETSNKILFNILELTHVQGKMTSFNSIHQCLDEYFGSKVERDIMRQKVGDLLKLIQNEKNKNIKKLKKLNRTIEQAEEADMYRIYGELLTASLHEINRGDKEIEVINYYDEDQSKIKIPLNQKLSPSENAQSYFKKYTKSKNSVSVVKEQIEVTQKEVEYLDTILQQMSSASLGDIDEIKEELIEQGYIRKRNTGKKKKKKNDKPSLTCYTSSEGIQIYVGKNNLQNEYLTNRFASYKDTWLHTKDIPGSHVVIKSTEFGEKTLEEAAMIAAYFSKAKESSQVPVDYTLIRHVRKPNGSKPGYVIYDNQKTVFITPEEEVIKKMEQCMK
ncbi:Rqc2 family fibronectin-binding protein [Chengkuizengella sediminis]|uniref:Rqc2 family fibronectin-binding protein n=1 Tax=Chengkuizengella sediminis TaxID=1885917 RepID=UPI00138A3225|nr:NFACT RNA binding domain-containing protein [Chengkuizengella sediminis]NDI33481.1 fibronectin/fibrinogen-binding protein [Chengkuizengella sediminis]